MASSIYCLNDILDVGRDRRHPGKCNRPIASGAVSRKQGVALMATCALLALGGADDIFACVVLGFCQTKG